MPLFLMCTSVMPYNFPQVDPLLVLAQSDTTTNPLSLLTRGRLRKNGTEPTVVLF